MVGGGSAAGVVGGTPRVVVATGALSGGRAVEVEPSDSPPEHAVATTSKATMAELRGRATDTA